MKKLPTWRCADGRILKLKDMEIGHLINTFHFLKRCAHDEYHNHMFAELVYNTSVDKFCLAVWPIYGEFRKEIANRLRSMKQGSIERKYWHMKFCNDSSVRRTKSFDGIGDWPNDESDILHPGHPSNYGDN